MNAFALATASSTRFGRDAAVRAEESRDDAERDERA